MKIENYGIVKPHRNQSRAIYEFLKAYDDYNGSHFQFNENSDMTSGEFLMDLLDKFIDVLDDDVRFYENFVTEGEE